MVITRALTALCTLIGFVVGTSIAADHTYQTTVSVYFSPQGGITDAVVREIGTARKHILMQAYSFTSAPIAKALIDAKKRGVIVNAVLDKTNETATYSSATFLANASIPVLIDDKHAIAYNKIMILDSATVITGSFNFTKAAEQSNAENLLILTDSPDLVQQYERNWTIHAAHSHPYTKAGGQATMEEPQDTAPSAGVIRGNKNSKVYQLPGCPGYKQSKPENVVTFASEADARNAGYHKAKNCP